MALQILERLTNESPDAAVIWLHGLGADSYDFYDIVPMLELPQSASIKFVFPNAPVMPVTLNNGYRMTAWYDIAGIGEHYPHDIDGIRSSERQILALIGQQQEAGIDPERIILAGFSQGGVVALHTALRYPGQLGGVLALSSYLAAPELLAEEKQSPPGLDIMMMHGTQDEVVSIKYGRKSASHIQEAGYEVIWKEFLMPHSVCPEQLKLIGHWIAQRLKHDKE